MAVPAAGCDIGNWEELDWYAQVSEVSSILQQKGFCLIQGNLEHRVTLGAQREARKLRRDGALTRVPQEALGALLGETASCWTRELSDPESEAPASEECLRQVDRLLEDVGLGVATGSRLFLGVDLLGRTAGVLHHSRMPEDRPAPPLLDLDEATVYMVRAAQRKVTLVYYLGPSPAKLSVTPREDPTRAFEVPLSSGVVLVFRSDACAASYATRGLAVSVQVDFVARAPAGPREAARDMLPLPATLQEWYDDKLRAVVENDELGDRLPLDFVRGARLSFFKQVPARIVQLCHDLPTLPFPGGASVTPFEATILGGQDAVTQIAAPGRQPPPGRPRAGEAAVSGGKWDIDEYYDEDPTNAADLKMYTKHLSVLSHGSSGYAGECELKEFGILSTEDFAVDHRCRMLCEAHVGCLHRADLDCGAVRGKEIGFYVGISGRDQAWNILNKKAKINKYTFAGSSNAAMVSRLSYLLDSKGASLAIDTEDSSGSAALDSAVRGLRDGRGLFAFASSASWIESPLELIMLCAAGLVAKSGRCRVFDETADGFVKGEGVVALLLEPCSKEEEEQQRQQGKGRGPAEARPLVSGSALNSKGQSSSLSAPNGPALLEVVSRAARDARVPFHLVDAVEANAGGSPLVDVVELGVTLRLLRTSDGRAADDRGPRAVPIRALKSSIGNLGPPNGLAGIARACALLDRALHGPGLHLRQALDTMGLLDEEEDVSSRAHLLTEVIEARGFAQLVGVSSFGSTGTNVHHVLWGQAPEDRRRRAPARPITWWPAGDPQEAKPPARGYFIVGTWTAWEECQLMEMEAEGVYGYTLTMGENNWECFQVWVDGDADRVVHPTEVRSSREARVAGPDCGVGRELCWYISGKTESMRLINEEQSAKIQAAEEQAWRSGLEPHAREHPCVVVFRGGYTPEGHEGVEDPEGMPLVTLNAHAAGKPGDRYRIRLHVRGRYKRLEWSKATGLDAITSPKARRFVHKYHLIGDHNYWTFKPMQDDAAEQGLYVAEVQLLKEESNFQIYRDADWEQGFHPAVPSSSPGAPVLGPGDPGPGLSWRIQGKVGDLYRVEFRRRVSREEETRSMHWQYVRSEKVDFRQLAASHRYFLVGSWTRFRRMQEMDLDQETGGYSGKFTVRRQGRESFQILLNGNRLAAVHPSFHDATQHGDGHQLEGPGAGGAGKYWTVGLHPDDSVTEGDRVVVHLEMSGGLPQRVRWEKAAGPNAHRARLASGCHRAFERECRLLGLQLRRGEGVQPEIAERLEDQE